VTQTFEPPWGDTPGILLSREQYQVQWQCERHAFSLTMQSVSNPPMCCGRMFWSDRFGGELQFVILPISLSSRSSSTFTNLFTGTSKRALVVHCWSLQWVLGDDLIFGGCGKENFGATRNHMQTMRDRPQTTKKPRGGKRNMRLILLLGPGLDSSNVPRALRPGV
jgi:hypothetical protein